MLFYIFVIFIIGTLLLFTDPNLLKNSKTDIAQSHFTILFDRAGVAFAASVINAVIFTAIFSTINSAKPTSLKTKISMIYHFKAKWYPLGPILALIMCVIVIIGQNYEALIQGRDFVTLLTSYIGLWLFLLIWAGYKLITKSKAIDPLQADIKRYNY